MLILTTGKRTKSQLSLLLRELGHQSEFHVEVKDLRASLQTVAENTPVLIDLLYDLSPLEVELLQSDFPKMRFIGFEQNEGTQKQETEIPASAFPVSIILPNHAERAKLRLKNTLRGHASIRRAPSAANTRAPFSFKRTFTAKREGVKEQDTLSRSRYLTTESEASTSFLATIRKHSKQNGLLIIESNEDAEFELIARELNFQSNSDTCSMYCLRTEDIRLDYLEKLERDASKERQPINCYVGRTDDLDECAAYQLKLFGEYLDNLRNPHARILIAHESGSEAYFQIGVAEHTATIRKKAEHIYAPKLADRAEDIATICQITLSNLRTAHPFLVVQRISKEAEIYLLEHRYMYSYTKLVRILRNAIGLSQRDTLTIEDLKNYGESDMTTQHLLETMADQNYFPQSANF